MFVQSTIICECNCIFESEFQNSSHDNPPKCPSCRKAMNSDSWKKLRKIMAEINDFNTEIVKHHAEYSEPLMLVPAIASRTLK